MLQMNKSERAYEVAVQLMPGGANSTVREFKAIGTSPIFFESGKGAVLRDIDDNEYIDYVLSWGPLILGHSDERVVQVLKETIEKGTSYGAPTLLENKLAKLVI